MDHHALGGLHMPVALHARGSQQHSGQCPQFVLEPAPQNLASLMQQNPIMQFGEHALVPANQQPQSIVPVLAANIGQIGQIEPAQQEQGDALMVSHGHAKVEDFIADGVLSAKPALVKLEGGTVMVANIQGAEQLVLWEWARVTDFLQLQTQKQHMFFKRNSVKIEAELKEAQIPLKQVHYKGLDANQGEVGHHMAESAALVLLMLLVASTRRFAAVCKQKSMCLMQQLLRPACLLIQGAVALQCTLFGSDGEYHHMQLSIKPNGIVEGWRELIMAHSGATQSWRMLQQNKFCDQAIMSSLSQATVWDVMLFLVWAKTNPSIKSIWVQVGQLLWPQFLWVCGKVLDLLAVSKVELPLEAVPLLKTKKGHTKRAPWNNKVVLLAKMKAIRRNRQIAMRSHGDTVPKNAQVVSAEDVLSTSIYLRYLEQAFKDTKHVAVHWDPSSYDVPTMVAIVFSHENQMSGYLPIQNMKPLTKSEIHEELQELAATGRLTRLEGYAELRALSHSLKAIGKPLSVFKLPEDVRINPLKAHQKRILVGNTFFVHDTITGERHPQVPDTFRVSQQPLCISISDMGGINRASLDYATFKLQLSVLVLFDPYHRTWNDIKECLKKSKGSLFRTLLAYALYWNSNYGPAGTKEWHQRKVAKMKDLMETGSPHQEPFLSFLPFICQERGIDEPQDAEGREAIWNSLPSMNTVRCLGPIVKLMRWFSWFQTEKWYAGENFACKLLMLESKKFSVVDGVDFIKPEKVGTFSMPSLDRQARAPAAKDQAWHLGTGTSSCHSHKPLAKGSNCIAGKPMLGPS